QINALAFMQAHVSLAPASAATRAELERFGLRFDADHVHCSNLDVEQRFDSSLHRSLVGVGGYFENVLVVFLRARGLFRHMRGTDHGVQLFVLDFGAHASHSSIFFTDSTVTSTLSASTRLTGSM